MAAGGFKEFVAGEVLDEDEINDYLMQGMLVFAGTAARGSAITSPVEGQFSFLKDSDTVEFYTGSAWQALETETPAADISGGGATATSGGYRYHVFTANGNLVVNSAGVADALLIGGGGSGGYQSARYGGGGGGAGGVQYVEKLYLSAGTASIVVGAGGAATVRASNLSSRPGNDSTLGANIVGAGGGAGGSNGTGGTPKFMGESGQKGGSGGGGAGDNFGGGPGITNQGSAGGNGGIIDTGGGGGGGASAVGGNAATNTGGNGGNGTSAFSVWGVATSTGQLISSTRWYAGGGGGGADTTAGTGGNGGGGTGGTDGSNGTAGTGNTGGGGGAAEEGNGAAGGSGLVIVRVAV